jgi:hypothetical protein
MVVRELRAVSQVRAQQNRLLLLADYMFTPWSAAE